MSSDFPDNNNRKTYTTDYHPGIKKRKSSSSDSDSSEDIEILPSPGNPHPGNPNRRYSNSTLVDRPWIIHPSTTRLHRLEELTKLVQDSEARSAELLRTLKAENKQRRKIQKAIEDLVETQLQEQLTTIIAKHLQILTDQVANPTAPERPGRCFDERGNQVHQSDLVEVYTGFSPSRAIGRVIQTEDNNIALVRITTTGTVIGTFGNRLRIVEEAPADENSEG